jgi:hypothetical protein
MIRLPTDVEIPTLPLVYAYTKADLIFVFDRLLSVKLDIPLVVPVLSA